MANEAKLYPIEGEGPRQSVRMTADRLLLRLPKEHEERRSRGGIVIPATAASESKRLMWGEVVAVGPTVRSCERGDRVVFSPEVAAELEIRDEEFLVLRERDVHAVASDRVEGKTGLYM